MVGSFQSPPMQLRFGKSSRLGSLANLACVGHRRPLTGSHVTFKGEIEDLTSTLKTFAQLANAGLLNECQVRLHSPERSASVI